MPKTPMSGLSPQTPVEKKSPGIVGAKPNTPVYWVSPGKAGSVTDGGSTLQPTTPPAPRLVPSTP